MENLVFSDECLQLYYDPENKLVRAVWNGFLSGENLRRVVAKCLDLLDEENPENWLADNRKLRAIRQHDQEWLAENLLPKLAVSSLKKMATIVSEDIFNQMAIGNLLTKATEIVHFDHQYFKSDQAAYKWLVNS